MENLKITHASLQINFLIPIEVGSVKLDAVIGAFVYRNSVDFDYQDDENITYMGLPVKGYQEWKKLREHLREFGIDIDKLLKDEVDKVLTKDFEKKFIETYCKFVP